MGEAVIARNNKPRMSDVLSKITKRVGPLAYLVETESDQIWKRHLDHLKSLHHGNVPDNGEDDQIVLFLREEIQLVPQYLLRMLML